MPKRASLLFSLLASISLLFCSSAIAKNYINIEIADEILALGEEYKIELSEGITANTYHAVDKQRLNFMPEQDKVFYEFMLIIEKGDKRWTNDVFIFSNQKNFINFDTLLFSELVDISDFRHLDHASGYQFFQNYSDHLDDSYATFKAEYEKGPLTFIEYMSPMVSMDHYMEVIYPTSAKLKKAVTDTQPKDAKPHLDIIQSFINDIGIENRFGLMQHLDPRSPDRNKDIYERGLQTLFSYFKRIGYPTKFKVVKERKFEQINRPPTYWFLVELLDHNNALNDTIEMEFYFADAHGERYIYEYDITGIHFQ